VRALLGSVRDVATIYASLEEVGLENKILIMGRGLFGENVLQFLEHRRLSYVMPARRNSPLYDRGVPLSRPPHPLQQGQRRRSLALPLRGRPDARRRGAEPCKIGAGGPLEQGREDGKKERMGHILIVSDLDRPPEAVYLLYKRRDKVEKQFEGWKSSLVPVALSSRAIGAIVA